MNLISNHINNLAFWRFLLTFISLQVIIILDKIMEKIMKDPRISIRLTEQEHEKLKIVAAKKHKKIQELMIEYIYKLIKEDTQSEEN